MAGCRPGLLGEEQRDVQLVMKLLEEVTLLAELANVAAQRSAAEGGGAAQQEAERQRASRESLAEQKWALLVTRCLAVAESYPTTREAMVDGVVVQLTDPASKVFLTISEDARRGAELQCSAPTPAKAPAEASEAEAASTPAAKADGLPSPSPAPTRAEPAPAPASARPVTDAEAVSRLAEFYQKANPDKTLEKIKEIWMRYRHDPKGLYDSLVKKYPEAEGSLGWMYSVPARAEKARAAASPEAKTPEQSGKKPAGQGTRRGQSTSDTPRRSRSMVSGMLAMLATPVAKVFGPKEGEDVPQAILPDEQQEKANGYYDEKLGRFVFPNDPEGEAEREALAAMMSGPPPPPVQKAPRTTSGPSYAYVDHFNAGSAPKAASTPSLPMPPMPPMPKSD